MEVKDRSKSPQEAKQSSLNYDGSLELSYDVIQMIYKAWESIWNKKIPQTKGDCITRNINKKGCIEKDSKCPLLKECIGAKKILSVCIQNAVTIIENKRIEEFTKKLVEILSDKI